MFFKNNKQEIVDTIYLIVLQGLNYIIPLLVFPYLMVTLGSEKFGYIGFSLSVVQYLMLIVDFGFNLTATKKISLARNNQSELNEIFWSTIWSKISLLIICSLILLFFSFGIPRFAIYSSTLLIMFSMVIANTFSLVWLFQGLGKIRLISIINTISKLLILPLTFWFVKSSDDYQKAALIQSLVYVLSSTLTIGLLINKRYVSLKINISKHKIISAIKDAYPVFLTMAATSLYTTMFVIILGYFSSSQEVGKYTAIEKIIRGIAYLIFIPMSQSFYPKISSMSAASTDKAKHLVKTIAVIVMFATLFLSLILFFNAGIITSILGKDYNNATDILQIMSFIPIFISVGGILGQLGLLAIGNEHNKKQFQKVYFCAGAIALLLMFTLIPLYNAKGTAWALFITEFTVLVGMLLYFKKSI